MTELKPLGEIDGREIYRCSAPLDKQLAMFKEVGATLPSTEQVAQIRLYSDIPINLTYTRTSVSPVARRRSLTILIKNSPILNPWIASQAVNAHRNGEYLEMPGLYDLALEQAKQQEGLEPEDRTALVLSQKDDFSITPEMPEARFLLGEHTRDYFEKFNHDSIRIYNIQPDSKQDVMNYLWFGGPRSDSNVGLWYRYLDDDYVSLGVSSQTAVGSSQKLESLPDTH
jgi:hypothetical protein